MTSVRKGRWLARVELAVVVGGVVALTSWGGMTVMKGRDTGLDELMAQARARYRVVVEAPRPALFLPVTNPLFSPTVVRAVAPRAMPTEPLAPPPPPPHHPWEVELRQCRFVGFIDQRGVKTAWVNVGGEDVFSEVGQSLSNILYVKSFLSKGVVVGVKGQPSLAFQLDQP